MTTQDEIATPAEGWVVRASIAIVRWSRRRTVRSSISEIYLHDPERHATLEEQLLLDRERHAARVELERIRKAQSKLRAAKKGT